jgi:hypothetical protein
MTTHRNDNSSDIEELVARWSAATVNLQPERARVPLHVLLGDAVDLAAFVDSHYHPVVVGDSLVPGLVSVEAETGITKETSRELSELQRVIAHVHALANVRSDVAGTNALARADRIVTELRAALGFLLDGSGDSEGEDTLNRLREAARSQRAHDAVAMVLEGYAALGARYRTRLASIGAGETLLEEALTEADALRKRSAERIVRRAVQEGNDLLRMRNRFVAALQARLQIVRRAIRYVFRDHPELAQHANSGYAQIRRRSVGATALDRLASPEPPPLEMAG